MSETAQRVASPPRFDPAIWKRLRVEQPFPPAIWNALPASERKRYQAIGERVRRSSQEVARLRRELQQAPGADHQAAAAAAAAGEEIPPASVERLESELREAERIHAALEEGLYRSTCDLLASAQPLAGKVAERLEDKRREAIAEATVELEALRAKFAAIGEVVSEANWTEALARADGGTVDAFRAGNSAMFRRTLGELTNAALALADDLDRYEQGRRELEAWRAERAHVA
jgi:hypothetical protein